MSDNECDVYYVAGRTATVKRHRKNSKKVFANAKKKFHNGAQWRLTILLEDSTAFFAIHCLKCVYTYNSQVVLIRERPSNRRKV